MMGCCGCEREKFRTEDGVVDRERLEALVAGLRQAGFEDRQIDRVSSCSCMCHLDGVQCLC